MASEWTLTRETFNSGDLNDRPETKSKRVENLCDALKRAIFGHGPHSMDGGKCKPNIDLNLD